MKVALPSWSGRQHEAEIYLHVEKRVCFVHFLRRAVSPSWIVGSAFSPRPPGRVGRTRLVGTYWKPLRKTVDGLSSLIARTSVGSIRWWTIEFCLFLCIPHSRPPVQIVCYCLKVCLLWVYLFFPHLERDLEVHSSSRQLPCTDTHKTLKDVIEGHSNSEFKLWFSLNVWGGCGNTQLPLFFQQKMKNQLSEHDKNSISTDSE